MTKIQKIILTIILFNAALILGSIKAGINGGNMFEYFEERMTVTYISALFLTITGVCGLIMGFLHYKLDHARRYFNFWFVSGCGFIYLSLDEYFMMHEGIDNGIASLFGYTEHLFLDGLVIGFFGLIALGVCVYFRTEILKYKDFILFLILGGLCLVGTVVGDQWPETTNLSKTIEESFKIVGVTCFMAGFMNMLFVFINRALNDAPQSSN